jgi:hypothetical protein
MAAMCGCYNIFEKNKYNSVNEYKRFIKLTTRTNPTSQNKSTSQNKPIITTSPITEFELLHKIRTIIPMNSQLIWEYIQPEIKQKVLFDLETAFLKNILKIVLPKIQLIPILELFQYINKGTLLIYKHTFTEVYYNISQKQMNEPKIENIWEWEIEYDILFPLCNLLYNSKNINDDNLKTSRHIIHSLYHITTSQLQLQ